VSSLIEYRRRETQLVSVNIIQLLREIATRCPGRRIPDTYLVFDLETTGLPELSGRHEYVTQFGYAVVENRTITANRATLLKTPVGWINPQASRITGITDEMIQRDGVDPKEFFASVIDLFKLFRSSGAMFVGHNSAKFDAPFIETNFKHFGLDFKFNRNELIDTGMLFKASQIFASPTDREDLTAFFSRVAEIRSRAKWNLTFAVERLGLDMKFGIDMKSAHDAGFDCKVTHLLLEELRHRSALA
jgi:DNA polymerase III epsilon subunit-like protein